VLQGVDMPVLAIEVEKIVLGKLDTRQVTFFELGGELFEVFQSNFPLPRHLAAGEALQSILR